MSAAERMRRARERRRSGLLVAQVEVTFDMVDELIERGKLSAWDAQDPQAIGAAIASLLRVTLAESTR